MAGKSKAPKIKTKGKTKSKTKAWEKKERVNPITVQVSDDGVYSFKGRSMTPVKDKNAALLPYGKQISDHGVVLALLPTPAEAEMINRTIGCARVVRNNYLDARIAAFKERRENLTSANYKADNLKALKKERPYLKEVDKFALESAVECVDSAYKNFFEGWTGFPKFTNEFKPSGSCYTTKQTNGNISLFIDERGSLRLQLPKIGKVRAVLPKDKDIKKLLPKVSRITKVTVKRSGNSYTASLLLEEVVDLVSPISVCLPYKLGSMDMGIRVFCDYGTGNGEYNQVENPKWNKK